MSLPYQYQALPRDNYIRLLVLPQQDDEARISIFSVPLEEAPRFEALSYVWGDPDDTVEIEFSGGTLNVTANLRDALDHLRFSNAPRRLWVDAVCINQADIEERTSQVRMMGLIYWHARGTVVWLGKDDTEIEDDEGTWVHVPAVDIYGMMREYVTVESWERPAVSLDDFSQHDEFKWKALAVFFLRPWFYRGWVIQELGLAAEAWIVCGRTKLYFEDYFAFMQWLGSKGNLLSMCYGILLDSQYLIKNYWYSTRQSVEHPRSKDFLKVLAGTRMLTCTDPRDYVYAFLGHPSAFKDSPDDEKPFKDYKANYTTGRATIVQPDYRKTPEEVYIDLARNLIEHMGNLEVLSYVIHCDLIHKDDTYPSWAPRWDIKTQHPSLVARPPIPYYCASSDIPVTHHFDSSDLHLRGVKFDTVECPHYIMGEFAEDLYNDPYASANKRIGRSPLETTLNIYKFRVWQRHRHRGLKPDFDAFYYTMTAGLFNGGQPAEEHAAEFKSNAAAYLLQKTLALGKDMTPERRQELEENSKGGNATQFLEDVNRIATERMFFITHEARIGIGPQYMKEDDECWILAGATVPFILRKAKGGRYKLLGEAYVHGVMRGEIVKGLAPEDFSDLTLC